MNMRARKPNLPALLSLLVVILISGLSACGGPTNAQPSPNSPKLSAPPVVWTYFKIVNAGYRSGDFSALATVYSPEATLTFSGRNSATKVVHGIDAIISFYQDISKNYRGYQFAQESVRSLDSNVVLSYERAGTQLLTAGRCVHLFVIQNGKIMSVFWVVYQ